MIKKKRYLMLIAATAVLLTAVICTAGCINPGPDPVIGSWYHEEGDGVFWTVFDENNTGTLIYLPDKNNSHESKSTPFTWGEEGKDAYLLQLSNGEDEHFIIDLMSWTYKTKDDDIYTKMANTALALASLFDYKITPGEAGTDKK